MSLVCCCHRGFDKRGREGESFSHYTHRWWWRERSVSSTTWRRRRWSKSQAELPVADVTSPLLIEQFWMGGSNLIDAVEIVCVLMSCCHGRSHVTYWLTDSQRKRRRRKRRRRKCQPSGRQRKACAHWLTKGRRKKGLCLYCSTIHGRGSTFREGCWPVATGGCFGSSGRGKLIAQGRHKFSKNAAKGAKKWFYRLRRQIFRRLAKKIAHGTGNST